MDFQQEPYSNIPPYHSKRSAGMATASLILGIIAIVTSGCIYLSLVCGSLGIILALLSRGGEMTLDSQAKVGLILSTLGLVFTIVLYTTIIIAALRYYGGFDGLLQESLKLYGVDSIEELYQGAQTF